MKQLARITLLLAAFLVLNYADNVRAQEEGEDSDEYRPAAIAVVERTVVLRSGPARSRPQLRLLQPASVLEVLSENKKGGFYFVMTKAGEQGWVWGDNVRVTAAPPVLSATAPSGPCKTSFGECRENGCADPATQPTQALFNRTKRRMPTGTNIARAPSLTFADFRSLQTQAARVLGKPRGELEQSERNLLRNLSVSSGRVREGQLVRVDGFIALSDSRPGANGGESVNCKFGGQEFNDFHIPLAAARTHDEFQGIVVEMIPQGRPAGWTLAKLRAIQRARRHVLVAGALFFDNIHIVNKDRKNPIGGQSARVSVWELHPVSHFFVCNQTTRKCDPNNLREWTPLADFVAP